MPRIAHLLPLVGSTLALMFVLGGARAALNHLTAPKPKTTADHEFLHCSTALTLIQQNRIAEALTLLKSHAKAPMPLPGDSTMSTEISPGTQIIMLSQNLIKAAEQATRMGEVARAHIYLDQCRTLEQRIRSTPQPEEAAHVAQAIEKLTQRAEVALLSR